MNDASLVPAAVVGLRAQFIDPSSETSLRDGVEYSATLTASEPIAVVANAHNDLPGTAMPMGETHRSPHTYAHMRRHTCVI